MPGYYFAGMIRVGCCIGISDYENLRNPIFSRLAGDVAGLRLFRGHPVPPAQSGQIGRKARFLRVPFKHTVRLLFYTDLWNGQTTAHVFYVRAAALSCGLKEKSAAGAGSIR
ncbi:MAG: hypothetical protein LIO46_04770 [Clostridiales bacterium]|nr:hypothetical protein [Clostridiales bacterium]